MIARLFHFLRQSFILILILGATCAQVFALFGRYSNFAELFTHYAPYYFLIGLGGLFTGFFTKRPKSSPEKPRQTAPHFRSLLPLLAALLFSLNAPLLAPYLIAYGQHQLSWDAPEPENSTLTLLSQNVYYQNPKPQELFPLVQEISPDLVIVHEASELWRTLQNQLRPNYPFIKMTQTTGIHGILVASRIAGNFEEIPLGEQSGMLFVEAQKKFQILAVHPEAPLSPHLADARARQLDDLVHFVHSQSVPTVIIGDFNCTPWSPRFHDLLSQSGLRDARVGLSLMPTWHAHNWLFNLLIDHALISPGWTAQAFKTHATAHSDHRAIEVELSLQSR